MKHGDRLAMIHPQRMASVVAHTKVLISEESNAIGARPNS